MFEKLRSLRTEIAREEKVPPYVVFSDKSLVHMCVLKPKTREEMLTVSGVGEFKYEKYGERFLNCVQNGATTASASEIGFAGSADSDFAEEGEIKEKRSKNKKSEFVLTNETAEQIYYSEQTTLSDLVGQINDLRDDQVMKRLTNKAILQKLTEEGYLEDRVINGRLFKTVTETGAGYGIQAITRISEKGNEYEVLYYNEDAQRKIVAALLERA